MRGFLKSREGIFQLALNTTTIGREGCDLFLSVCIYLKEYFDVCIFVLFIKTVVARWCGHTKREQCFVSSMFSLLEL